MINKRGSTHPFHFSQHGFPPFSMLLLREKAATSLIDRACGYLKASLCLGVATIWPMLYRGIGESDITYLRLQEWGIPAKPGLLLSLWPLSWPTLIINLADLIMGLSLLTKWGKGYFYLRRQ